MRPRRDQGVRSQPPRWVTPRSRPRVLVEYADDAVRGHLLRGLRLRGYDALGCPGPDARATCPLLHDRPCPAVAEADAVVTGLVARPPGRAIATIIHALAPDRPLIAEGTQLMLHGLDERLQATPAFPLEVDEVADALDATLATR